MIQFVGLYTKKVNFMFINFNFFNKLKSNPGVIRRKEFRVDRLNKNQSAISIVNTLVNTFTYVVLFNLLYDFLRKLVWSPFYMG